MEISLMYKSVNYKTCKFENDLSHHITANEKNKSLEVNFNKIWLAVDNYFDLGDMNKSAWMKLTPAEQSEYWKIIAKLIKKGVVGYRYYEVNGQIEKHFIEYEIANPKFAFAKIKYYSKKQYTREWVV
ncbi:MAG: hypothetical protein ACUVQ1_03095 [Candidatus Kapaibacteriales bacterium]